MNEAVAFFHNVGDLTVEQSFAKHKLHADACTLAGLDQALPSIQFVLTEQEQLDECFFSTLYVSVNARRNNLGVIDNQHVTLVKVIEDIIKMTVCDALLGSVKHHQARGVAFFHGVLRNELFG